MFVDPSRYTWGWRSCDCSPASQQRCCGKNAGLVAPTRTLERVRFLTLPRSSSSAQNLPAKTSQPTAVKHSFCN